MRKYIWANWNELDYESMPYRQGFKSVAGWFEFPVDRFNVLENKLELPTYSIVKDPVYNLTNLTNDWECRLYSILDQIADRVFKTAGDKTIVLTWSGGIDSSCILVSLQKHPKFKEKVEQGKFKVALTSISIDEYPEQFYRDILPSIPIITLDYLRLMQDPDVMLVTGDMGDHVIGSSDVLRFTDGKPGDLDLMLPWRHVLPRVAELTDNAFYQDLMFTIVKNAPFEIKSINQMTWWWANALDHQDDLIRPWYWSTTEDLSELASQNKVFRFFYDDALMTFSFEYMSTNPEYHTYIDNKLWFKRYIVNSTGDEYYLNKQKIFSQRMSLRHVFKTQIYYENDMIKCSKRREVINGTKQS